MPSVALGKIRGSTGPSTLPHLPKMIPSRAKGTYSHIEKANADYINFNIFLFKPMYLKYCHFNM